MTMNVLFRRGHNAGTSAVRSVRKARGCLRCEVVSESGVHVSSNGQRSHFKLVTSEVLVLSILCLFQDCLFFQMFTLCGQVAFYLEFLDCDVKQILNPKSGLIHH